MTAKKFIVEREQKLIQRNHVIIEAENKKEAMKKAEEQSYWGNAEFELINEKIKVARL